MDEKSPYVVEEKKAYKKTCPFIQMNINSTCQGEKCMAWRWAYSLTDDYHISTTHGYCALIKDSE